MGFRSSLRPVVRPIEDPSRHEPSRSEPLSQIATAALEQRIEADASPDPSLLAMMPRRRGIVDYTSGAPSVTAKALTAVGPLKDGSENGCALVYCRTCYV